MTELHENTRLEALTNAAEQFLAIAKDGNVAEMLEYLKGIFEEALETAT